MTKGHVLIIEDDNDVRDMLCTMLSVKGWKTRSAADGRQGLAALGESVPDVVLCDVMMPDIDGMEVHAAVRADSNTVSLPFVFVSAILDPRIVEHAAQPNCSFVRKPFTLNQLEDAISVARSKV